MDNIAYFDKLPMVISFLIAEAKLILLFSVILGFAKDPEKGLTITSRIREPHRMIYSQILHNLYLDH